MRFTVVITDVMNVDVDITFTGPLVTEADEATAARLLVRHISEHLGKERAYRMAARRPMDGAP